MKFKKGDRVIINPRKRDCPWYSTKIYTIINHRIGREGEKVSKLNENLRGAEQFGYPNEINDDYLIRINEAISLYNQKPPERDILFFHIKNSLPSGFLQRRIWCINYRCFQNIYNQRIDHRLIQWKYFCEDILKRIEHPEFIKKEK